MPVQGDSKPDFRSVAESTAVSLLDNPIWNALATTHARFAEGDELAKRYPPAVTPLAAVSDPTRESYDHLAELLLLGQMAGLFLEHESRFPSSLTIVRRLLLNQMVLSKLVATTEHPMEELDSSSVSEMLALVEMTQPGPFGRRTIEMGSYLGIRVKGQLAAMAGERVRIPGYTEVSAVCTRPEHRGRGYASLLVSELIRRITARKETPFLHVAAENTQAVRVYEKLGFKSRKLLHLAVVKKELG